MSFALLTPCLLCALSAQAQSGYPGGGGSGGGSGGYPGGGWSVLDPANNPIVPNSSGYPLKGIPTGSASNTYPADMTAAATAPPFYDNYGQWVNNRQWLQADSGGPHSYDPNPLGAYYLYTGGPGPLSTSISLNSTAGNVAGNNSSGAFNKGRPPFFTDQMYQLPSDCEPLQGSATGAVQGTLWAYWTWTGSSPAPVDHLNILLTTRVAASSSLNYGNSGQTGGLTATAQASDGNPFNESASVGGVPLVVGHHLLRVPVTGGVAAVSLNGNVQGSASNSVPYGAFGYPYYGNYYGATNGPTNASSTASVSGTAVIDPNNRGVTISSDIEDSYYKGAYDSQHGTDRYLHQRDPSSGKMSVDAVATYSTADNARGGSWIANATLIANPVGFSAPTYSWASDFNPVAMVGVDMTQQSIPAGWFIGDVSNLPSTKNIAVTVQDGPGTDGATATNTYTILWHQPFEQWTDCQPAVVEEIDLITPSSQPTNIPGGQVAYAEQTFHCTFEFGPNQMADGLETAQKILPITQPFFGPIWQSLIGAAGQPFDKALLGVSTSYDVVNSSDPFTEATYLTSIGKESLVPRDGNGNFQTHEKYKMVAGLLSAHYRKQFLQGDAYNVHGYAGPSPTKTARKVFKVQATGRYAFIYNVGP